MEPSQTNATESEFALQSNEELDLSFQPLAPDITDITDYNLDTSNIIQSPGSLSSPVLVAGCDGVSSAESLDSLLQANITEQTAAISQHTIESTTDKTEDDHPLSTRASSTGSSINRTDTPIADVHDAVDIVDAAGLHNQIIVASNEPVGKYDMDASIVHDEHKEFILQPNDSDSETRDSFVSAQPIDVHHVSVEDSLIEHQPLTASTPYQHTVEVQPSDNSLFVYSESAQTSDTKSVIISSGVDDYMSEGERQRLVTSLSTQLNTLHHTSAEQSVDLTDTEHGCSNTEADCRTSSEVSTENRASYMYHAGLTQSLPLDIHMQNDTLSPGGKNTNLSAPTYHSSGNLSSTEVLSSVEGVGLGYSMDSIHSAHSQHHLYSPEKASSSDDIRSKPLLERMQKMGVMVLPQVTRKSVQPSEISDYESSNNDEDGDDDDEQYTTAQVLSRVLSSSSVSKESHASGYSKGSKTNNVSIREEKYESTSSLQGSALTYSSPQTVNYPVSSVENMEMDEDGAADEHQFPSAGMSLAVPDVGTSQSKGTGEEGTTASYSISNIPSPTLRNVNKPIDLSANTSLLTDQVSPPHGVISGSPERSERSENTGTSVWSISDRALERMMHSPSAYSGNTSQSSPGIVAAAKSLTSLDAAGRTLDKMISEQHKREITSGVSKDFDPKLAGESSFQKHGASASIDDILMAGHAQHDANNQLLMSLPSTSRDGASVDSGRGSGAINLGDSLQSSLATTLAQRDHKESTETASHDNQVDISHSLVSQESEHSFNTVKQQTSQATAHLPNNLLMDKQRSGSGSSGSQGSKEIERWLRGMSPFKDSSDTSDTGKQVSVGSAHDQQQNKMRHDSAEDKYTDSVNEDEALSKVEGATSAVVIQDMVEPEKPPSIVHDEVGSHSAKTQSYVDTAASDISSSHGNVQEQHAYFPSPSSKGFSCSNTDLIVIDSTEIMTNNAHVDTPRSSATQSCSSYTDYQELPQDVTVATTGAASSSSLMKQPSLSQAGPLVESSQASDAVELSSQTSPTLKVASQTSPAVDTSSVVSSELDRSVERILLKYANVRSTDESSVGSIDISGLLTPGEGDDQYSKVDKSSIGVKVQQLLQRIDTTSNQEDLASSLEADIKRLVTADVTDSSASSVCSSLHASDLAPVTNAESSYAHVSVPLGQQLASHNDTVLTRIREMLSDPSDSDVSLHLPTDQPKRKNSTSSQKSTARSSSISYEGLQRDLDDIEHGLRVLQSGDLQVPLSEAEGSDRDSNKQASSEAESETVANTSYATLDSGKQYNWDYSADLASNRKLDRFVSTNDFMSGIDFLDHGRVTDVVSPDVSVAQPAEDLSGRVEAIMQRESPPRQAYKILEDISRQQQIKGNYSTTPTLPDDSQMPLNSRMQSDMPVDTFHFTPVHMTPLSSMSNLRATVAAQVSKVSSRNFETSFDKSSLSPHDKPSEQQKQKLSDCKPEDLPSTADYVRETLRQYEIGKEKPSLLQPSRVISDVLSPSSTPNMSFTVFTPLEGYEESSRLTLQQETFRKRQIEIEKQVAEITQQRKLADLKLQETLAQQKGQQLNQQIQLKIERQKQEACNAKARSESMPKPTVMTTATNTSPQSDSSSIKSSVTSRTRGLKPYKPLSGSEVLYVESGTDDAGSVTTMESTHTGSDDAQPPLFPPHVLGSRVQVNAGGGIYSRSAKHEQLGTIPELSTDDKTTSYPHDSNGSNKAITSKPVTTKDSSHIGYTPPPHLSQPHTEKETAGFCTPEKSLLTPKSVLMSDQSIRKSAHRFLDLTDASPTIGEPDQRKQTRLSTHVDRTANAAVMIDAKGNQALPQPSAVNVEGSTLEQKQKDLETYLQQQEMMRDVDYTMDRSADALHKSLMHSYGFQPLSPQLVDEDKETERSRRQYDSQYKPDTVPPTTVTAAGTGTLDTHAHTVPTHTHTVDAHRESPPKPGAFQHKTRPFEVYNTSPSARPVSTDHTSAASKPQDLNEMWERFLASSLSTMRTQSSEAQRATRDLDVKKLAAMLDNPVQHLVKLLQDKEERRDRESDIDRETGWSEEKRRSISWEVSWDDRASNPVDSARRNIHVPVTQQDDLGYARATTTTTAASHAPRNRSGPNDREVEMRSRELLKRQWDEEDHRNQEYIKHRQRLYGDGTHLSTGSSDMSSESVLSEEATRAGATREQHHTRGNMDTNIGRAGASRDYLYGTSGNRKTSAAIGTREGNPHRKFICVEETLDSIPEDSTLDSVTTDYTLTTSADDTDTLVISRSKKDLPADPKLLRIQQKIRKQKEKQKAEANRAERRKQKIEQLQELLTQAAPSSDLRADVSSSVSGLDSTSTPPPLVPRTSHRYASFHSHSTTTDSSTLTAISSDTMTGVASDASSVCECQRHDQDDMSFQSPRFTRDDGRTGSVMHGNNYTRARSSKKPPTQPPNMKLREVDYSRTRHKAKHSPPKSSHTNRTPSKKHDRLNSKRSIGVNAPTPIHVTPPTKRNISRAVTMVSEAIQTDSTEGRASRTATTKQHVSHNQHQRPDRHYASSPESSPVRDRDEQPVMSVPLTPPQDQRRKRQQQHPQRHLHAQQTSDSMVLKEVKKRQKSRKKSATHKAGNSWFIPMNEPKPWRKPLRERQAYAVSREHWAPGGDPDRFSTAPHSKTEGGTFYSRSRADVGVSPRQVDSTSMTENRENIPKYSKRVEDDDDILVRKAQGELQDAFAQHMQMFVSRSRIRQKQISLRSAERRVQDLNQRHNALLYDDDNHIINAVHRATQAERDAHPYSRNLYQPAKRAFTRQEMKEITLKRYQNLPEVQWKAVEKKRIEEYKTNRMRARLYNKKVQNSVLRRRWIQ